MADFVVTESGFGSDCGAEKFFSIKCRASGLVPTSEVIVCTIRALKLQSGRFDVRPGKPLPPDLLREDLDALEAGLINLEGHIDVVRTFGVPVVVAVNRFPGDTDRELQRACEFAASKGARVAICDAFARGGEGALELAETVEASSREAGRFTPLYDLAEPLEAKLDKVACGIYGADGVDFEPAARRRIERLTELGYGGLPVCVAKTQYSFSHDPKRLGRPRGFRLPIREVRLFAGAGYVQALAGDIQTMPGLPLEPAAMHIDVDADGVIRGM
jgi:formate--tetrahydrofolate ligase